MNEVRMSNGEGSEREMKLKKQARGQIIKNFEGQGIRSLGLF